MDNGHNNKRSDECWYIVQATLQTMFRQSLQHQQQWPSLVLLSKSSPFSARPWLLCRLENRLSLATTRARCTVSGEATTSCDNEEQSHDVPVHHR